MSAREELLNQPVTSPFYGDTNIQWAWDSTSLEWLKRCPRLYQYSMIEHWRPKDESIHLRFGIEYHQALHEYDVLRTEGFDHLDSLHRVVRDLLLRTNTWRPVHKYKTRDNLLRTVIWYLDKFPAEDDPAQTYILADGSPACEVSFRFETEYYVDEQVYVLCGHLDKIVTYNEELFVMDRKTTTTTPSAYYFNQFEPNNQMTLYTLAGQVVLHAPIKGVIIDSAQVLVDSSRFTRGFTQRSKDQLEEWIKDLSYWLERAETYACSNYWPQNDTACDKFGGCAFREVCSKSPGIRKQYLKSHFTQEVEWNPLATR